MLEGGGAGASWRIAISFEEHHRGTRVAEENEMHFAGLARFASPLLARLIARSSRNDLGGLKRRLEAASEAVPAG